MTETFERVKASYVVGNNLDNMVDATKIETTSTMVGSHPTPRLGIYHNIGDANDRNEYAQNSDGSFSNIRTGERAASTAQMSEGLVTLTKGIKTLTRLVLRVSGTTP